MQGTHARGEGTLGFTLGDVVAAVMDVADDERQATEVVVAMLRSGSVRLHRAPASGACAAAPDPRTSGR